MKEATSDLFFHPTVSRKRLSFPRTQQAAESWLEWRISWLKFRESNHRLFFCGVGGGAGKRNSPPPAISSKALASKQSASRTIFRPSPPSPMMRVGIECSPISWMSEVQPWRRAIRLFRRWRRCRTQYLGQHRRGDQICQRKKAGLVLGVVGKAGRLPPAQYGDAVVVVPNVNPDYRTTHTESWPMLHRPSPNRGSAPEERQMGIGDLGLLKAVFLDRDGVIIPLSDSDEFGGTESPLRFEDFRIFPWTAEAIKFSTALGFYVFVATNQPAVAKEKNDHPGAGKHAFSFDLLDPKRRRCH